MAEPTDPAAQGAQDPGEGGVATETAEEPQLTGLQAALARARENLATKGTLLPTDDGEETPTEEPAGEAEEEEEVEAEAEEEAEDDETEEETEAEAEEEADEEEQEVEAEEPEEEEETDPKKFTASLPGRHPGDPDVEIEVEDQALAERINQLRNNGMRREQFETAMVEIQAAQDELAGIEEEFTIDPAGFVLNNLEGDTIPTVALALLTEPKVWDSLKSTLEKLFDDPKELRTLQAEAKAARLETKDKLKEAATARKQQTENARQITNAIDLMVPETLVDSRRQALIKDLTRDIREHIERNKLQKLDAKDLPTIVADRLQLNGIDPLDARKAIKQGKRSQGKPSTAKKTPPKKPKSGKELHRASVKRKQVAAAPGPGKKAAPTEPKKLPAGQTIQERVAAVKKAGGIGVFLGDR